MYRPSWENRTSEMEDMISEKKERAEGSSSCSNSALSISVCAFDASYLELTLGMLVTERILSHVRQLYRAFRARVHKPIAALWVEFSCGDHLCQLLHVRGFDVDNIEALILNVEIP